MPSPHSEHMPPVGGSGESIASGRVSLRLGSGPHGRDVEVLLGVVKLVNIVFQVPLWEVLTEPELAGLEWLVIDQRKDLFLGSSVVDDFAPDCFVFGFAEE